MLRLPHSKFVERRLRNLAAEVGSRGKFCSSSNFRKFDGWVSSVFLERTLSGALLLMAKANLAYESNSLGLLVTQILVRKSGVDLSRLISQVALF